MTSSNFGRPVRIGLPVQPAEAEGSTPIPILSPCDIRMPKVDGIEVLRRVKPTELKDAAGDHAFYNG